MKQLIRLSAGLVSLCMVLILVARAVAPHAEAPFPLNTLNAPGCQLPCWHGIQPGVTTFREAEAIMDADPAYDRVESLTLAEPLDGGEWRLHQTPDEDNSVLFTYNAEKRVVGIRLYGRATPGHVITALGSPTSAIIAGMCFWQSALFYASAVAYVMLDDPSPDLQPPAFQPTAPGRIFLYLATPDNMRDPLNPDPWRGFRANYNTPASGDLGCD